MARQLAAIAVRQRQLGTRNLAFAAHAHQLLAGFHQRKQAIHAGVYARQAAAIGVHGQAAAWGDAPAFDKTAAFAFGAKAQIFQKQNGVDGESVVEREQVNIAMADACLGKSAWA